jgi:pimeloyl-ACP methyl ester carboxylesterase
METRVADVLAVMDDAGIKRPVFFGYSMGGTSATPPHTMPRVGSAGSSSVGHSPPFPPRRISVKGRRRSGAAG